MDSLRSWLTTPGKGWTAIDNRQVQCTQSRRFSTGVNPACGSDSRLFLDTQSWGSVFGVRSGDFDKAISAIDAAEKQLIVGSSINQQPVTGFNDSCLPRDNVIWYGGTAQMIVAYHFAGNTQQKDRFLGEMAKVQNPDGSWNHSSMSSHQQSIEPPCNSYDSFHVAKPHVGETAWNYFALRDAIDGMALPYELTPLANDSSLPTAARGTMDIGGSIMCDAGACDSGSVQVQIGGSLKIVFYDGSGTNGVPSPQAIAEAIASAFNADLDSPVSATASQGSILPAGGGTDWQVQFVTSQRGPNVNYQVSTSVSSIMFGASPQTLLVTPPPPYTGPGGTQNWIGYLSGGH